MAPDMPGPPIPSVRSAALARDAATQPTPPSRLRPPQRGPIASATVRPWWGVGRRRALGVLVVASLSWGLAWPTVAEEKDRATENQKEIKKIIKGLKSSFRFPFRDLQRKEYPRAWRNALSGFSGGFGLSYPLETGQLDTSTGSGTEGERGTNATLLASLRWQPVGSWFASVTFHEYLEPELQRPWNPDFSYVFGYDDWRPYTLSFTYANYGGNRLNPDRTRGERPTRFEEGVFTLAWKFIVPEGIKRWLVVHPTGGLGGSIGITGVPRYFDLESGETRAWKRSVQLNLKYTIYKWWYINATLIWYPIPEQQQPWDPDFTWGFGYFDWHPGKVTVQYNNYSGNRFPWRDNVSGTGRFRDGSVSVSWSWSL